MRNGYVLGGHCRDVISTLEAASCISYEKLAEDGFVLEAKTPITAHKTVVAAQGDRIQALCFLWYVR